MAFEKLGTPRYKKWDTTFGINIRIPSKKKWFGIFFTGFMLIGWALIEFQLGRLIIFTLSDFDFPELAYILFIFPIGYLVCWTAIGILMLVDWLWQIMGFEEIIISDDSFIINKRIPIWNRSKRYNLEHVVSARVSNPTATFWNTSSGNSILGKTNGKLAFDYGTKTIRFGNNLEEAEAKQILKDIQSKFPNIVQ